MESGRHIGKYKIIKELGAGGMGQVFLVYDSELQRTVALKTILGQQNQRALRRFQREAKLNALLEHPNIAKVYEFFFHNGIACIVMQYIEGKELLDYYNSNNLTLTEKLEIIWKTTKALGYAHKKKVLHRDLKPENILVSKEGEPYIMDFGLAKTHTLEDKSLTKTGEVLGTPNYMSPEQAKASRSLDHRSDIYALGAILYETITGSRLIKAKAIMTIMYEILYKNNVVFDPQLEIPQELKIICFRALEKKAQKRYVNAEQMALAIKQVIDGELYKHKISAYLLSKNPYVKSLVLLLIIATILSLGWWISSPQIAKDIKYTQEKIQMEPEREKWLGAIHLLKIGSYKNAQKEFTFILDNFDKYKPFVESKKQIQYYSIIALAELQQSQKVIKSYQDLPPEWQQKTQCLLAMVKAYYFLNDLKKTIKYLEKLSLDQNDLEIYQQICYWWGRVKMEQKEYGQAISYFVKVSSISESTMAKYYVGMCSFEQNDFAEAEKNLQQVQSLGLAVIHRRLGQIYLKENPTKALQQFQKGRELEPDNSRNQYLCGKAQEQLHDLESAFDSYIKTLEMSNIRMEAFEGCIRVLSKDVTKNTRIFSVFTYHQKSTQPILSPDFIDIHIQNVLKHYQNDFLQWNYLQQRTKNTQGFIKNLRTNNSKEILKTYRQTLIFLRYHPQIEKIIQQKLMVKENADLRKILHSIQQKKLEETRQMLYYKIAYLYRQIPRLIKQERDLKQFYTNELKIKTPKLNKILYEIVHDSLEKPVLRYLALKALTILKEDKKQIKQPDDLLGILIFACVLNKVHTPSQKIKDYFSRENDEFLALLIISRLQDKDFLINLLKTNDLKIKLTIAAKLWKEKIAKAGPILLKNTSNPSATIRTYSHYNFWHPLTYKTDKDILKKHHQLILRGFRDTNYMVQRASIHALEKYALPGEDTAFVMGAKPQRMEILRKNFLLPLKNLVNTSPDPIVKNHAIRYLGITTTATLKNFKEYLGKLATDKQQPPYLRSVIMAQMFRIPEFWRSAEAHQYMRNIIRRDQSVEFRTIMYGTVGVLGVDLLPNLKYEKTPEGKAMILLVSGTRNPLSRSIGRNYRKDLKLIQTFFNHPSKNIRRAAAAGYLIYNVQYKTKLFSNIVAEMVKNKDMALREGTAIGGYTLLHNQVLPMGLYLLQYSEQYRKSYEELYSAEFRKRLAYPNEWEKYIHIIHLLKRLDPEAQYPREEKLLREFIKK